MGQRRIVWMIVMRLRETESDLERCWNDWGRMGSGVGGMWI